MNGLISGILKVCKRIEPRFNPPFYMVEHSERDEPCSDRCGASCNDVERPSRRDVEHPDEYPEQQQRRTKVLLVDQHHKGRGSGDHDWSEMSWFRENDCRHVEVWTDINNIAAIRTYEGAGFRVLDLGTNVPAERFLAELDREPAEIVGLSSLLSSTLSEMSKVIAAVRSRHPATRVLVGGAPVTQAFADEIGADGYAADAYAAVRVARSLVDNA